MTDNMLCASGPQQTGPRLTGECFVSNYRGTRSAGHWADRRLLCKFPPGDQDDRRMLCKFPPGHQAHRKLLCKFISGDLAGMRLLFMLCYHQGTQLAGCFINRQQVTGLARGCYESFHQETGLLAGGCSISYHLELGCQGTAIYVRYHQGTRPAGVCYVTYHPIDVGHTNVLMTVPIGSL